MRLGNAVENGRLPENSVPGDRLKHRCFFAMALALLPQTALAAGPKLPKSDFSLPDEPREKVEFDTENIFGQTDGTDVNAEGEREISFELAGRLGRRGYDADNAILGKGHYGVFAPKLSLQYGLTDNFEVEASVFGDLRNIRNTPGLDDKSTSNFNGLSAQFTWRLLERTRDNRFGLAVSIEPKWGRIADVEGFAQDSFSAETKIAFDARLIDSRLWYGSNLGIEPQVARTRADGRIERQSTITWSHALSARVLDNTFVGVEARYLRNSAGFAPRLLQGQALYLGPTLYHQFSKSAYLRASWSTQVWGRRHNAEVAGSRLDLQDFEQQTFKIKLGMNF